MQRLIAVLLIALLAFPNPAWAAQATAVFAGGCFWCLEHDLEHLPGVIEATSGYSGGQVERPTYRQVSSETTGHQEAVQVRFDPDQISYAELLRSYWRNVDPLDGGGQFCDRGDSYRPVIFTADDAQSRDANSSAEAAARELDQSVSALKVEIRPAARFWPAEGYHQNYAELNSLKYNFYRFSCGRDRRLDDVWGDKARSGNPWSD
tara:strand:+ start:2645 stop:3262 length:618 start_codon:yes stop_codon:yes gene_type:complete